MSSKEKTGERRKFGGEGVVVGGGRGKPKLLNSISFITTVVPVLSSGYFKAFLFGFCKKLIESKDTQYINKIRFSTVHPLCNLVPFCEFKIMPLLS